MAGKPPGSWGSTSGIHIRLKEGAFQIRIQRVQPPGGTGALRWVRRTGSGSLSGRCCCCRRCSSWTLPRKNHAYSIHLILQRNSYIRRIHVRRVLIPVSDGQSINLLRGWGGGTRGSSSSPFGAIAITKWIRHFLGSHFSFPCSPCCLEASRSLLGWCQHRY